MCLLLRSVVFAHSTKSHFFLLPLCTWAQSRGYQLAIYSVRTYYIYMHTLCTYVLYICIHTLCTHNYGLIERGNTCCIVWCMYTRNPLTSYRHHSSKAHSVQSPSSVASVLPGGCWWYEVPLKQRVCPSRLGCSLYSVSIPVLAFRLCMNSCVGQCT